MGDESDADKVVGVLRNNGEYGLTLTELIMLTGLSYSVVTNVFEELEDMDFLLVKSDGLSRIYKFKE